MYTFGFITKYLLKTNVNAYHLSSIKLTWLVLRTVQVSQLSAVSKTAITTSYRLTGVHTTSPIERCRILTVTVNKSIACVSMPIIESTRLNAESNFVTIISNIIYLIIKENIVYIKEYNILCFPWKMSIISTRSSSIFIWLTLFLS